jgi:hypothetical protein
LTVFRPECFAILTADSATLSAVSESSCASRSAPEALMRFAPVSARILSTGATGIGVSDFRGMVYCMSPPFIWLASTKRNRISFFARRDPDLNRDAPKSQDFQSCAIPDYAIAAVLREERPMVGL